MIVQKIKSILRREFFFPTFISLFFNPFFFARSGLACSMKANSIFLTGDLLDVGCGSKPYESLFAVSTYVGLDIDTPRTRSLCIADYFYDGTIFPFDDHSFDSILCNQVLEHVFTPNQFLSEIYRVLRPGGKMLLTVPFVWDEHEQPYDYARYSSFGLKALLNENHFAIIYYEKLCPDLSVIFQLANAYFFKISLSWPTFFRVLFTIPIYSLFNLLGLFVRALFPSNPDLFLDHLVLVEKPL